MGSVLPPATCIVVSVMASTSLGKLLTTEELRNVNEACNMANQIYNDKMIMQRFVEMRMSIIAPNLCKILGSGTTAMIVAQAGGLSSLAKMPADVLRILGNILSSKTIVS